jgi:O-acetyl-ADP-ribose deacetylase (regulator of RNase III)
VTSISYVIGDATDPPGEGHRVIAHVCNDRGAWGAGFSGAITRRWRQPERDYRDWYTASMSRPGSVLTFALGNTWFTPVGDATWVASMVAQHGTRGPDNPRPIRYEALRSCLEQVGEFAESRLSVHMPRIGCGLAGGTWEMVEPLIEANLTNRGVAVSVYDLA